MFISPFLLLLFILHFNYTHIWNHSDIIIVVLSNHSYFPINDHFLGMFFIPFYLGLFIKHGICDLMFFFSSEKFSTIIFSNIAFIIFFLYHSGAPILPVFFLYCVSYASYDLFCFPSSFLTMLQSGHFLLAYFPVHICFIQSMSNLCLIYQAHLLLS